MTGTRELRGIESGSSDTPASSLRDNQAELPTGLCIIELSFDERQRPIDYGIAETNPAFQAAPGFQGNDVDWMTQAAPGHEETWLELCAQVASKGEPLQFKYPARTSGHWYDVLVIRVGNETAHRVAILLNDITRREALELRQQVLLELNDAVRDLTNPAEIAQASSRILADAMKVSRVGYGVMDTAAETITIERDYNAPGVRSIAGVIHFRDFGDYIEDLARGDVVVFDDAGHDSRVTDGGVALDSISARALINLPLIERGQVVALLFVNNATPRHWSRDDIALVREVAERVRSATERARATVSLLHNAERLRFLDALNLEAAKVTEADEVLAITTEMTARHLGVANCAYADMDADQDGFTIRGDWAEPGMASIVGHYRLADFGKLAVQELGARRPLIINDNSTEIEPQEAAAFQAIGIGATICMPLVKEGRLTALMAVHHRGSHRWTDDELETIREVAERSWAHVERVRAEAALREEKRALEILNTASALVAADHDLERVVQRVTDAGVALSGAQFGAFFYNVLDEAGESYMLYALSGVPAKAFSKFPMPRNTAIFAPTFSGEGIVRSDDITARSAIWPERAQTRHA